MTQQIATTNNKPQMLTVPQLEATQIMPGKAIRKLIAEKKIKTIKVGNRHYVNYDLFLKYLNGESVEG